MKSIDALRDFIEARDNRMCRYCYHVAGQAECSQKMVMNRVHPNGQFEFRNLVWSCVACSKNKRDLVLGKERAGVLWRDNLWIVLRKPGLGERYLYGDGTFGTDQTKSFLFTKECDAEAERLRVGGDVVYTKKEVDLLQLRVLIRKLPAYTPHGFSSDVWWGPPCWEVEAEEV